MEEIELILDDTRERMEKSVQFLVSELKKIRAGKASPSMLDGISVDYYGAPTPLVQVASITSPDPRTLFIKPWEKTIIQDIEKAIMNSELGLSPQNDGENIIINIPALTEERRMILAKQIKSEGEKGKISVRSVRKESNESLKKLFGFEEIEYKSTDLLNIIKEEVYLPGFLGGLIGSGIGAVAKGLIYEKSSNHNG